MYIKFSTVKKTNHLEAKWAKCATAVAWEEKAISSFEALEVFFLPVFAMVDDVLPLKEQFICAVY